VDINGGNAGDAKPTQGWNGSFASPQFFPDQYGVTWSPWGGSNAAGSQTFGDGTVWPQSATGQAGTAGTAPGSNNTTIFNKVFGTTTVSLSAAGTASQYGSPPINSRDRGAAAGSPNYNGNTTAAQTDVDAFRDLIFGSVSGSNVQGTNYLQLQFSGLTPGQPYRIALYSFDNAAQNITNWTATAPTTQLGVSGWFQPGTNTFAPPADEQTINWRDGAMAGTLRAPATFTVTADGTGVATVWGFGGDGLPDQNAGNSYLNAFQIMPVPEPASLGLGLMGAAAAGVLARRRAGRASRR
jgi:hypothetical protein